MRNAIPAVEQRWSGQCWTGQAAFDRRLSSPTLKSKTGRLDVALVTHPRNESDFVRLFPWGNKLTAAERREVTSLMRGGFGEISVANDVSVGVIFLPLYADDILNGSASRALDILVDDGLGLAARHGTRIVCLGGLTGVLSQYGEAIRDHAQALGINVATGHSMTAVSVARTMRKASAEIGRDIARSRVAVLGLGSVGLAFLRILLMQAVQPAEIVLIDRPGRRKRLDAIGREALGKTSAGVSVEFTDSHGDLTVDSAAYRADFVVSAISATNVIDVSRVRPGTVLIDDSQPYCWSRSAAWDRCITSLDIVPCEAGLIDCSALGYRTDLPFDFADNGCEGTAWSCLTEGLLCAVDSQLVPTIGEPTEANLRAYEAAFDAWKLRIPPLQCAPQWLPMSRLRDALRERRRNSS
jgi:predicted amino acid dehydrogenase